MLIYQQGLNFETEKTHLFILDLIPPLYNRPSTVDVDSFP